MAQPAAAAAHGAGRRAGMGLWQLLRSLTASRRLVEQRRPAESNEALFPCPAPRPCPCPQSTINIGLLLALALVMVLQATISDGAAARAQPERAERCPGATAPVLVGSAPRPSHSCRSPSHCFGASLRCRGHAGLGLAHPLFARVPHRPARWAAAGVGMAGVDAECRCSASLLGAPLPPCCRELPPTPLFSPPSALPRLLPAPRHAGASCLPGGCKEGEASRLPHFHPPAAVAGPRLGCGRGGEGGGGSGSQAVQGGGGGAGKLAVWLASGAASREGGRSPAWCAPARCAQRLCLFGCAHLQAVQRCPAR